MDMHNQVLSTLKEQCATAAATVAGAYPDPSDVEGRIDWRHRFETALAEIASVLLSDRPQSIGMSDTELVEFEKIMSGERSTNNQSDKRIYEGVLLGVVSRPKYPRWTIGIYDQKGQREIMSFAEAKAFWLEHRGTKDAFKHKVGVLDTHGFKEVNTPMRNSIEGKNFAKFAQECEGHHVRLWKDLDIYVTKDTGETRKVRVVKHIVSYGDFKNFEDNVILMDDIEWEHTEPQTKFDDDVTSFDEPEQETAETEPDLTALLSKMTPEQLAAMVKAAS